MRVHAKFPGDSIPVGDIDWIERRQAREARETLAAAEKARNEKIKPC